ncbi:trimeric intracellular cation channel family protein [uncultured Mesonia sp.]|uniref:trimeric intracellular cation channel family protein n=1 Tax=uncultured Mesonia sp. TaxID=399731 RepID=UPI00374F6DEA
MDFQLYLDILGTIAFAISGVLTAMRKRMDAFGIFIIAFITAVGGGTLRDILIKAPIAWMHNLTYLYVIIASTLFAAVFRSKLIYFRRSLFLFDTIGIGLYTVIGMQKAIMLELPAPICIAVGTISACFGGVLRDILCNEIPIIFRKEIYATACIAGGLVYFALNYIGVLVSFNAIIAGSVVIVVRLLAVIFKLQLPSIYQADEASD